MYIYLQYIISYLKPLYNTKLNSANHQAHYITYNEKEQQTKE